MNIAETGGITNYVSLETSKKMNAGSGVRNAPSGSGISPHGALQANAAGNNSGSISGRIYDPKDLNKDGVVDYEEELQYDLMHPMETRQNRTAGVNSQNYYRQVQTTNTASPTKSIINVYA